MTRRICLLTSLTLCALSGCVGPHTGAKESPVKGHAGKTAESAGSPVPVAQLPEDPEVRSFLAAIHQRIGDDWRAILAIAKQSHPPQHPVNQQTLVVQLELRIAADGTASPPRISKRSGCKVFDNSALRVMSWVRDLPPLPAALQHKRAVIRWHFFRDQRGADPRYVQLEINPLPAEELLWKALNTSKWEEAQEILVQNSFQPSMLAVLADRALLTQEPKIRRLALELAATARIEAAVLTESCEQTWQWGVELLRRRKAADALLALLEQLVSAGPSWKEEPSADSTKAKKIKLVLFTLDQLEQQLPEDLQSRLLRDQRLPVLESTIALTRSPELLGRLYQRVPQLGLAIHLRLFQLGQHAAAAAFLRQELQSERRLAGLQALAEQPVPPLVEDLAELVKDNRLPADIQLAAIAAYGKLQPSHVPLYRALRSSNPEIQIAAVRALSEYRQNQRSIAYRLSDLAAAAGGKVAAEAIVAITKLGLDHFCSDVIYRTSRLKVDGQALVASELWRLGSCSRGYLQRLSKQPHLPLQDAARASLARIDAGQEASPSPPPVPPPAIPADLPRSPLAGLLVQSLRARRQQ